MSLMACVSNDDTLVHMGTLCVNVSKKLVRYLYLDISHKDSDAVDDIDGLKYFHVTSENKSSICRDRLLSVSFALHVQLLETGVMHADPHAGNLLATWNPGIGQEHV